MAKSKIPNPLERRHLIEKDLDPDTALGIAEAYLDEGRQVEALEFLAKADARDRLAALSDEAVASGDVFLLQAVARATDEEPSHESWERIAEAAEAAGKERYAATARRQLGRGSD